MWVTVILSSPSLCVFGEKKVVYRARAGASTALALSPHFIRSEGTTFVFVSVCGLWSLPLGKRSSPTLFHAAPGLTSSAHNICLDAGRGLGRALSQPGPLFIHQFCLRMCGCVWSWGPPLSLTPLSLNTHPLSACWRGLGSFWALALGPQCVCDICPS